MKKIIGYLACGVLLSVSTTVMAQQINLDKAIKAGSLTLFQEMTNPNSYYYLSDKPHLAKDANGRPQFSFLRYVENASAKSDQAGSEGLGGGIVHAVVSLEVTPEQLAEARTELQKIKPGAQIKGPVIYTSGKFAIITSMAAPANANNTANNNSNLTSQQIAGIGDAPVLDGEKAAISILLTKEGAKILWESFKSGTPDISFAFTMKVSGYRQPIKAVLKADFDQIYNHKSFAAGISKRFMQADIKMTFDDLRKNGAIKLEQIGTDIQVETAIAKAYNALVDLMFDKADNAFKLPTPDGTGNTTSLSDEAKTILTTNRDMDKADKAAKVSQVDENTTQANSARATLKQELAVIDEKEKKEMNALEEKIKALDEKEKEKIKGIDEKKSDAEKLEEKVAIKKEFDDKRDQIRDQQTVVKNTSDKDRNDAQEKANTLIRNIDKKDQIRETPVSDFAVKLSFTMKKSRQKGTYTIDLSKSLSGEFTTLFAENIGNLSVHLNNSNVFRQVNLNDPLFIQREIMAYVDGANAQDFGKYINFVTVRLRKTHEDGSITNQEIRIDQKNFNTEGNNFRMIYGWSGDDDRKKWMNYEYETEWSFMGGQMVKVPSQKSQSNAIALLPPFEKRTIEFLPVPTNAAPDGIRLITVKTYYLLNGVEQRKVVTLNPASGKPFQNLQFLLPANSYEYQYEIEWKLNNNQVKSSGRLTTVNDVLDVGTIPAT